MNRAVAKYFSNGGGLIESAKDRKLVGGSGGILPQKVFKFGGSETLLLIKHLP